MHERITDIEIKLAHLEQTLNELNDVVVKHSDLIDRLGERSEQLLKQLESGSAGTGNAAPSGEKPPHY